MRHAVLLGRGKYADERAGFAAAEGPRPEFLAIAQATDAPIFSYVSSERQRGRWFKWLFQKKPHLGSALHFALLSKSFDRCYVTGEDIGIFAALFLKVLGWKGRLYCVVHNITPKKSFFLRVVGHRIFGGLIIVSEGQRALLVQNCQIPAEKVHFRHNWVDELFFSPAENAQSEGGEPALVVACGAENRDYAMLSEAAVGLDMRFEIYGHGFFGANLHGNDQAALPNFRWMPRVPFPDLVHAYRRSDAVAVPLNNVQYAAGVTGLVEAMSCGKPVIVTETAGLDGYIEAIELSLRLRPNDTARAVEVFESFMLRSRADNSHTGQKNREWILDKCSLLSYSNFILGLMEQRSLS